MDHVKIQTERLSIDGATHLVTSPSSGAISVFAGKPTYYMFSFV